MKQWIKNWLDIRTSDVKLTNTFDGDSDITQQDKNAHFNDIRDITVRSFDALKDLLGVETAFDEYGDTCGYQFVKKTKKMACKKKGKKK